MYLGTKGVRPKFLLGRGNPAWHNVTAVHFIKIGVNFFCNMFLPCSFNSQGIEISNQGANPVCSEESGYFLVRSTCEKKKGDIFF